MAEGIFQLRSGALYPVDEDARAALAGMKEHDCAKANVTGARNLAFHRYYWKLCSVVAENSAHFPNPVAVSDALKIATGRVVHVRQLDGTIVLKPASIAFGKMSEADFRAFVAECKRLIGLHIMPQMSREQWDNVDAMYQ